MKIGINHILCVAGFVIATAGFCLCSDVPIYVWLPMSLAGIGCFGIGGFGTIK